MEMTKPLTADGGTMPEDLSDLRIHFDVEILVLGDLVVPDADLCLDQIVELLSYHSAGDVYDELLRQPSQLLLIREIYMARWFLFDEVADLSYAQPFILGHEGVFEMLAPHVYKMSGMISKDLHFFLPASRSLRK